MLASEGRHSDERAIARTYEGEKVVAFFAEVEREGGWRPPPAMRVLCVGGEVELDFRRAELAPGDVVNVRCRVVGGTVEIEAPKHLNVECAGTSLMGSFSRHSATSTARSGRRPCVSMGAPCSGTSRYASTTTTGEARRTTTTGTATKPGCGRTGPLRGSARLFVGAHKGGHRGFPLGRDTVRAEHDLDGAPEHAGIERE